MWPLALSRPAIGGEYFLACRRLRARERILKEMLARLFANLACAISHLRSRPLAEITRSSAATWLFCAQRTAAKSSSSARSKVRPSCMHTNRSDSQVASIMQISARLVP